MKKETAYTTLTPTERQDRRAELWAADRVLLIQRVLNEVYETTEAWRDNGIGVIYVQCLNRNI